MPHSPWPSQPLTCAMQHMSSNTIKLLLEKFQVCPDDIHTWLDLHRRLRNKTHQHPKNQELRGTSSQGGGSRNSSYPTKPKRGWDGEGLLTKLSRTYSSSPMINVWVAIYQVVGGEHSTGLDPNPSPQDTSHSTPNKSESWTRTAVALNNR